MPTMPGGADYVSTTTAPGTALIRMIDGSAVTHLFVARLPAASVP